VGPGQRLRRSHPHQEGRRRIQDDQRVLGLNPCGRGSGWISYILGPCQMLYGWASHIHYGDHITKQHPIWKMVTGGYWTTLS